MKRHLYAVAALLLGGLCAGCNSEPAEPPASLSRTYAIPAGASPALNRAMQALEAERYTTALAWTDSAELAVPGLAATRSVRGRILLQLGRMAEAEQQFEQVLARDSTYEGAWLDLGIVAFQQEHYGQALEAYQREHARYPTVVTQHAIGGTYEALGQPDSAYIAYTRALAFDSTYAPAWISLSNWYETEGVFQEALVHAERALAIRPAQVDYQYRVGTLLFRVGRYEEAVTYLRAVAAEQPWNYGALFTLGQAIQRLGQAAEAEALLAHAETVRAAQSEVERLQRVARDRPNNAALLIESGNALRSAGRLDEALSAYLVAASLRPENLSLQTNIATLYLQQQDTTEALERYAHVLQQDSTFAEAWLNLGLHYVRTGRPEQAQEAWSKAQRYGEDSPAVRTFFERMRKR